MTQIAQDGRFLVMSRYSTRPAGALYPGLKLPPAEPGLEHQTVQSVEVRGDFRVVTTTSASGTRIWKAHHAEQMRFPRRPDGHTTVHERTPRADEVYVGDFLPGNDEHPEDLMGTDHWRDLTDDERMQELLEWAGPRIISVAPYTVKGTLRLGLDHRVTDEDDLMDDENPKFVVAVREQLLNLDELSDPLGHQDDSNQFGRVPITSHGPYVNKKTRKTVFFYAKSGPGRWNSIYPPYNSDGEGSMRAPDQTSQWAQWVPEPGATLHPRDPRRGVTVKDQSARTR